MTNYEKIKAMSVEEMARLFDHSICELIQEEHYEFCIANEYCGKCIKKWLLQEAEE